MVGLIYLNFIGFENSVINKYPRQKYNDFFCIDAIICYICDITSNNMIILGHIFGIIVLIFGIILLVRIIRYAVNFDFDAPLFKTDITISYKKEDKN